MPRFFPDVFRFFVHKYYRWLICVSSVFHASQSARGLAHSKTLRVHHRLPSARQRLGLRRPPAAFPCTLQAVNTATDSVRGWDLYVFDRPASRSSRGPMSSANSRCCCRSSTITSGDGGADFSASLGEESRMEKFTAKIKIQTAASPAHALGCGQNKVESCWLKVASQLWRVTGDG